MSWISEKLKIPKINTYDYLKIKHCKLQFFRCNSENAEGQLQASLNAYISKISTTQNSKICIKNIV